ncbi:unnamed protein product [Calypogeia fissa]
MYRIDNQTQHGRRPLDQGTTEKGRTVYSLMLFALCRMAFRRGDLGMRPNIGELRIELQSSFDFIPLPSRDEDMGLIRDLLSTVMGRIWNLLQSREMDRQIHDEEPVHKVSSGLPQHPVGRETQAEEVQELLKGGAILGICGMGGIGKTTLARQVFNNISKDFEYTCFIDNVKGLNVNELQMYILSRFYHNGIKLDMGKTQWSQETEKKTLTVMDDIDSLSILPQWSPLKDKKTLLVMDGTDSWDQLRVLPPWQDFGDGSCLIITSRNRMIFRFYQSCISYEVPLLSKDQATQLFRKHAFGSDDILRDKSQNWTKTVNAVAQMCGGLPLTLEVMGRYLCNETSKLVWEKTIDNLQNAIAIGVDLNANSQHSIIVAQGSEQGSRHNKLSSRAQDMLWATLELSYENLSKAEQDMFCDAATFFFQEPLDTFLAAWSDRKAEITWKNLVDRAMVKEDVFRRWSHPLSDFVEHKGVGVHEQLRILAKRVAKDTILGATWSASGSGSMERSNVKVNFLLDQLNSGKEVFANTKSLRLEYRGTFQPTLQVDSLVCLKKLRYMAIFGILHECRGTGLTRKLRLLRWDSCTDDVRPSFKISLINMNELAVLQLSDCVIPTDFPETLLHLLNLRVLELKYCDVPEGFHEALGNLKNLRILSLTDLNERMQSLPESFGSFSVLRRLELVKLKCLALPESFGQLKNLQDFAIYSPELQTLPNSFGALESLRKLVLKCPNLERLPNGFGGLSSLQELTISCRKLKSLSSDFGGLRSLKELTIYCSELKSLSDDFGKLVTLMDLTIFSDELEMLPETFGDLPALKHLKFQQCHKLEALPDSFGELPSLCQLELIGCVELQSLPDSFGQLAELQDLKISVGPPSEVIGMIRKLPESFAELKSLRHLVIDSISLDSIPDYIMNLPSLFTLELGSLPYVKDLPPWLGETGEPGVALSHKTFEIRDEKFVWTGGKEPWWKGDSRSVESRSEHLFWMLYRSASKKVSTLDYEGALEILCLDNSGLVLQPWLRGFMLQERGIIKRRNKDLAGASRDLTAALGIFSEGDDLRCYAYPCWKHRGFANFLRGKFDEAQKDAEMALKLRPRYCGYPHDFEGDKLGEEPVTYMNFTQI